MLREAHIGARWARAGVVQKAYFAPCACRQGSSARIERKVCAADRDGLQGAKRSNSRSYCEHLQRRRPLESADAHGEVIRAEAPWVYQCSSAGVSGAARARSTVATMPLPTISTMPSHPIGGIWSLNSTTL